MHIARSIAEAGGLAEQAERKECLHKENELELSKENIGGMQHDN